MNNEGCTNEEIKLLETLADPGTHEKFIEHLESLGLLASFLEAMNAAKQ